MAAERRNTYLDAGLSNESDQDAGYDSEAAEISKAGRATKRRKIERDRTDDEEDEEVEEYTSPRRRTTRGRDVGTVKIDEMPQPHDEKDDEDVESPNQQEKDDEYSETRDISPGPIVPPDSTRTPEPSTAKKKSKPKKVSTPGVVYLSSLPPYLKPSALRNILEQRGFGPIARIFLSPASKSNKQHSSGGKNSRQLYTEGWIEFSSKKTAKRCAETLNATTVGGKKGGYYRDDVWNMKYLRGMRWEELMAGVREEKREMEGRRDEERRIIARETKMFVEGVEEGRRQEGMKRKRDKKRNGEDDEGAPRSADGEADVRRTWRQNEVKGKNRTQGAGNTKMSDDVQQVLRKIF